MQVLKRLALQPRAVSKQVSRIAALCCCVCSLWAGVTPSAADSIDRAAINQSRALLAKFQASHELMDAVRATDALNAGGGMRSYTLSEKITVRREVFSLYLEIAQSIAAQHATNFDMTDPKNMPYMTCVRPPTPNPGGQEIPLCSDPQSVKDPAQRAAYKEAIQINESKRTVMNLESRYSNVEDHVVGRAGSVLEVFAMFGTPPDSEITNILERSTLKASQKVFLKREIDSANGVFAKRNPK